jgi:hypothetical protein
MGLDYEYGNISASQEAAMVRAVLIAFLTVLCPVALISQTSVQYGGTRQVQVQDGGTRQVLESIIVPPKANSPFVTTLHTEWVRGSSDNGTITFVNDRRIARDSSGRIYQERWLLVPKNGNVDSQMNAVQISDPSEHTLYTCFLLVSPKVCTLTTYSPTTSTIYNVAGAPAGPLPNDAGYVAREDLGHQMLLGVDTVGSREIVTYNPGVIGNDQKINLTREYWYAERLGINLLSKRSDPSFGTQIFTVTEINLSEPDVHLFELPQGFKVVDHRQADPPAVD